MFSVLEPTFTIEQTNYTSYDNTSILKFGTSSVMANRSLRALSNTRKEKMHSLLYLSLLMLTHAADVETNPGPRTPKFPCQICTKAVTWRQRGVACDDCEQWYHADCMCMPTAIYDNLHNISWICVNCGIPNFSSSLFNSTLAISENSFSQLDISNSISSPGPPVFCSSPKTTKKVNSKNLSNELRSLIINFQSIKNKIPQFNNMCDSFSPNIILGNETWLNRQHLE